MSFNTAFDYLNTRNFANRILQFTVSSATVDLAAKAVGCEPQKIAKSLTFMTSTGPVMIICAGDAKISNQKYKAHFNSKAKMLTKEEVTELIGHDVGGVCPFGIKSGVDVYLDLSLKRFDFIYPACGSDNSAVKLTPDELFTLSSASDWIDVCTIPD